MPDGKLRFALTARYIRPELIDPENHWKGNYTPDPTLVYNGDLPPASADASVAVHGNNGSSTNVAGTSMADGGATSAQAAAQEAAPTPGGGASPVREN